LVKEADALVEAGHDVYVIGAHWAEWASATDARLLADRGWTCTLIDWRRHASPRLFWKTRARLRMARAGISIPMVSNWLLPAALSRLTPELTRAALERPADLYIAHNLGALPAAAVAAARHRARLGFDAEDFHSGEFSSGDTSRAALAVLKAERRFVPHCDYVTAASSGIAEAYAPLCRTGLPVCVLNVFPLASRPSTQRTATQGPLSLYWFSQTIGPRRGLEDAVAAMGRFADGEIELNLRGNWQAAYHETIIELARASNVNPARIIWHAPADPDQMVALAAGFDVGLALEPGATPNNDVALSNKIFTYLLAGAAVVATGTRGQASVVDAIPDAARSYRPGDIDAMAKILRRWVDDRTSLHAARQAAWTYGATRYNWDREKREFLDVIDGVLRGRSAESSALSSRSSAFVPRERAASRRL
jgi:glycosyltransferase involved in cell wall biosynthesis